MTERGDVLFVITYGDLALLEGYQVDTLWTALGYVVKARVRTLRAADRAAAPLIDVKQTDIEATGRLVTDAPVTVASSPVKHSVQVEDPKVDEDSPSTIEPVQPSPEDEALFAVIRADPTISVADAERAVGLAQSRATQRIKLLDRYGTLPADIKEWREARSKARGVAKGTKLGPGRTHPWRSSPADPLGQTVPRAATEIPETFEERRQRVAGERHAQAWRDRHPETA
jgi:hypothetical protein